MMARFFAFCSCIAEAPICILLQISIQIRIKKTWIIIPHTHFSYFPTFYGGNQWRLAFRVLLRLNREKKSLQEPCMFSSHLIALMQPLIHQCHSLASSHWHCTFLLLCSHCLLILQDWCLLSLYLIYEVIKGN